MISSYSLSWECVLIAYSKNTYRSVSVNRTVPDNKIKMLLSHFFVQSVETAVLFVKHFYFFLHALCSFTCISFTITSFHVQRISNLFKVFWSWHKTVFLMLTENEDVSNYLLVGCRNVTIFDDLLSQGLHFLEGECLWLFFVLSHILIRLNLRWCEFKSRNFLMLLVVFTPIRILKIFTILFPIPTPTRMENELTMWWGWGSMCGGKWWGGMPGWYPGGICPGGPGGMRPLECGGGGIMPCNAAGWPGGNCPGWGADSAWFRNTWMASSNRSSIRLCCKKNFFKKMN